MGIPPDGVGGGQPVASTAPFVVITGAILTIPVLAVTTLVTTRVAGG